MPRSGKHSSRRVAVLMPRPGKNQARQERSRTELGKAEPIDSVKGAYRPPTLRFATLTPAVPLRGWYAKGAQEQERASATCANSTGGARGGARGAIYIPHIL
jgi:hypothetical protein